MILNFRRWNIYRERHLKFDFVAAIVVFLVAIPLCLGIALASNAPLFSGILSGVIGGIIVGALSNSQVSVSGPAAGMVAVVITISAQLGGFQNFLLALMIAGVFQMLIGIFRAGFIGDYVPSNVVQGLLCAIGILLIVKQLPLAFTLSASMAELKMHLLETTEGLTLGPVYNIAQHLNGGAIIISLCSFSLLVFFDQNKRLKHIPAPIIVVFLGIILNEAFTTLGSTLAQKSSHLVHIPHERGMMEFFGQMQHPNWEMFSEPKVYLYAAMLAIVASLETLLNVKAGEKLDTQRRSTSEDRELIAQGTGNFLAGLLGGIPITSVIVRTSVNIQAGSHTKFAAILHGVLLFAAVILIPKWLNLIPLSSLASILIYTGYKLNKPSIYKSIYKQGVDRYVPFMVTLIGIVAFNLLEGILLGLFTSLFFILKSNSQARLDIVQEQYPNGIANRLILPQQISFLNKASLVAELEGIPTHSQLIIDARYTTYIDKEIIELIKEFRDEKAPLKEISLNLIGFKERYAIHNYIDFINVTTYDVQSALSPQDVLNILQEGNLRFRKDNPIHRMPKVDMQLTASGQHPIAVVLGCIDSRVPVETVFDMSFGDLFCVRIAGNVVNDDILASIEYACDIIGAKLVVILGHTACGAIQAACDHVENGAHIHQLIQKIEPAMQAEKETPEPERNGKNTTFVTHVTQLNIANTLLQIYERSTILKSLADSGTISFIGALYDVKTGRVVFQDYHREFQALTHEAHSIAKITQQLMV
ncbi:MAG: SulP family inorganic anion transporter [Legionellaceae bacterium]|nr:SulP family inorganic anion transporter [Legionellaceae bacterium]